MFWNWLPLYSNPEKVVVLTCFSLVEDVELVLILSKALSLRDLLPVTISEPANSLLVDDAIWFLPVNWGVYLWFLRVRLLAKYSPKLSLSSSLLSSKSLSFLWKRFISPTDNSSESSSSASCSLIRSKLLHSPTEDPEGKFFRLACLIESGTITLDRWLKMDSLSSFPKPSQYEASLESSKNCLGRVSDVLKS